MTGGKGHPLPRSGEARHNEIPESLAAGKGRGQDPAEITTPHPDGVNPDGEPYRYDGVRETHGSALSVRQGAQVTGGRGADSASFDGEFGRDQRADQDRGESEAGQDA